MPTKLDLTGRSFGRLTVVEPAPNKGHRTQWKCKCDCGKEFITLTERLQNGTTASCGCLRSELVAERNRANIIDLTGQRFGLLTVESQAPSKWGHSCWVCRCDCGNKKVFCSTQLKYGDALSCGCLRSSFGEKRIETLLKEYNINYKKEYVFSDLLGKNSAPLRFDFALFSKNGRLIRLIEYDGEQHFLDKTNKFWNKDTLQKRQERDKKKNLYCIEHNYPLIRIPYWEKNNITILSLLDDKYLIQEQKEKDYDQSTSYSNEKER